MKTGLLTLSLFLSYSVFSLANKPRINNSDSFHLEINKVSQTIKLDGILDEEIWVSAQESSDFINKWPLDTGLALAKTKVRLLYDQDNLYISAVCYQDMNHLIIQSLKRDNPSAYFSSDGFAIVIDPINQKSNGYFFGVNAGGAQIEATLTARGSQTNMDSNWDNKWFSSVKRYEDHWVAEMAIPFKTLRYNNSKSEWGINLIRNDMKRNAYSTWAQVPLGFPGIDLGYFGTLDWDDSPEKTKGNIALVPYLSGGKSKNHEDNEDVENRFDAGLDAKIALTSSLNLDLTLNPDFSNVDVDQQVTNVSRFSVFFPEKRSFFLENSDLFSGFGNGGVRPFFSRRIGIDDGDPVPIAFGARISGNLTDDIRIGIMDVHTRSTEDLNPTNYFVGSIQRRVLKRSSMKLLFNNKQDFPTESGEEITYNRTGGAEFNYTTEDGRLNTTALAHWSTTDEKLHENQFYSAMLNYRGNNLRGGFNYSYVGQNYIAEMGFTPRLFHRDAIEDTTIRIGYQNINPWIGYQWYGDKNSNFNQQESYTRTVLEYGVNGEFLSRKSNINWTIQFKSNLSLRVEISNRTVQLQVPTDLIDADVPLPIDRYDFTDFQASFSTNNLKKLTSNTRVSYGSFFSGTKFSFREELNFRSQPWGVFGLAYEMNKIDLGEEYGSTTLHLISPKSEISIRNNIWWTTFLQYNTQNENFNINSRLQWRYKPMSDFFIVYSDNYATTGNDLQVKNRGLVFKLTYWLNI